MEENFFGSMLEGALAGVVGFFAWFFGGVDGFLKVFITFVVIDYILGLLDLLIHEQHNKKIFVEVIAKKVAEFCFVGISHIIDKYLFGDTAAIRLAVTLFYITVEGVSIMTHIDALGLPIPQYLRKRFIELEQKLESGEGLALRGEGIKRAIESEIFRDKVNSDNQGLKNEHENKL